MSQAAPQGASTRALEARLAEVGPLAEAGKLAEALAKLDEAGEPERGLSTFHYVRGTLLVQSGEFDRGVQALERAVALEPEVPEMRGNLGGAFLEKAQAKGPDALAAPEVQEDLERARALLEEAAKAGARLPEVHSNHGRALHLLGRLPEAHLAFERALALDATFVPALYNQAAAYAAEGKDEEVVKKLDRLLQVAPDFEPARESRRRALSRLGRDEG